MRFVLPILLSLTLNKGNAQSKKFDWSDTAFDIGSQRRVTFYWQCEGPCSTRPCYEDCDTATYLRGKCDLHLMCLNKKTYDTLISFLIQHPNLIIEMKFYRELDGSEKFKTAINKKSALLCKEVIAKQGADTSRITVSWLGNKNPRYKKLGPNVKGYFIEGPDLKDRKSGYGSYGYPGCVTVTIAEIFQPKKKEE